MALIDTGSHITCFRKTFYDQCIKLLLTGRLPPEKQTAHHQFRIMVANQSEWQVHHYGEIDFDLLGLRLDELSFLVTDDSGEDRGLIPQMTIGQNTIKKACKIFIGIYGEEPLKMCMPPDGVNILLFAQLVVYYHTILNEESYESRILRGCIQSDQIHAKKN